MPLCLRALLCLTCACLASPAWAAGEHERFEAQLNAGRLRGAEMVIDEWRAGNGLSEAQFFVDAAKLHFTKAALQATDSSAAAMPVANDAETAKGLELLEQGSRDFPLRLDIHLDLASVHQELGDAEAMMAALTRAGRAVSESAERLTWSFDQPFNRVHRESPSDYLAASLQSLASDFIERETESADAKAEAIASLAVRYVPEHVFGHNTLGVLLAFRGEHAAAVQSLQRAHDLAPQDLMVLSNLSRCRHAAGDTKGALQELRKALNLSEDPETREALKARMKAMKAESKGGS